MASIYCANQDDRSDLIQDIIVQLWRAYPRYDAKFALSTWAYRIALNVSISFLRKQTAHQNTREGFLQQVDLLYCEDEVMKERLLFLHRQMGRLKPIEKAILILHLDGCQNKEIAEIMGMTASNISTILYRIKKVLIEKAKTLNG